MSTTISRPLNIESLLPLLPSREADSHKRDHGHALVLGGDAGKGGAALLAAEAALRVGAGLVSVATHATHAASFLARRPELMVTAVNDPGVINVLMDQVSVLVAGPGLGRGSWGEELLRRALQEAARRELPVLLDADALNLLAEGRLDDCREACGRWVLTPHAGEAARLLKTTSEAIQADREQAVQDLALLGGAAVLKGHGSLVCFRRDERIQVERCLHGNPGMASGGMGDVLSGVIGGLLAQGLGLADATRLGVCLHSKAADLCSEQDGMRGLLASDLFPWLRRLLNP